MTLTENRTNVLTILIVATALEALAWAPVAFMGLFTFMAFDAPGSEKLWGPWVAIGAGIGLPALAALLVVTSWVLFLCRQNGWALAASAAAGTVLLVVWGLVGLLFTLAD